MSSAIASANRLIQRHFPWFILASIAVGLRWRFGEGFETLASLIVATNMFVMALKCSPRAFRDAIAAPGKVLLATGLLYGVMPVVSFVLARSFLPVESGFGPGLILISVLPAGITSSVWTGISKGNLPLNLTVIAVTTLLSGIVTPFVFSLLVGVLVEVDAIALFKALLVTVMIPVVLGVSLHTTFERRTPHLKDALELLVKLGICTILVINGSILGPYLSEWGWRVAGFGSIVILQALIAYGMVYVLTRRLLAMEDEDVVALTYAVSMRNNGAGIVLALAHFGPVVAMPVIFFILVQQPIASLFHRFVVLRRLGALNSREA